MRKSVLIIGRESTELSELKRLMEKSHDRVFLAKDFTKTIEVVKKHIIDVIVLDLESLHNSAQSIIDKVRNSDFGPYLILVSGESSESEIIRQQGYSLVSRPINPVLLYQEIKGLFSNKSSSAKENIQELMYVKQLVIKTSSYFVPLESESQEEFECNVSFCDESGLYLDFNEQKVPESVEGVLHLRDFFLAKQFRQFAGELNCGVEDGLPQECFFKVAKKDIANWKSYLEKVYRAQEDILTYFYKYVA